MSASDSSQSDGWVTIARTTRSHGPDTVSITIRSGDEDIEATLGLDDFAQAVTGLARVHGEVRRHPVPARTGRLDSVEEDRREFERRMP